MKKCFALFLSLALLAQLRARRFRRGNRRRSL